MKGLENQGATCWLNALVQCLRKCKQWDPPSSSQKEGTLEYEFYRLVSGDTDNTTHILQHLPSQRFGNTPSDSQEALIYIIDKLGLKEFIGEETQTLVYPGGRSVKTQECTLWFHHRQRSEIITEYRDDTSGNVYNVAVIQRELTKVPEILISDFAQDELYGKELVGVVCWGWGHYIAYVKDGDDWWYANDEHIRKTNAYPTAGVTIAFYGVGKAHAP